MLDSLGPYTGLLTSLIPKTHTRPTDLASHAASAEVVELRGAQNWHAPHAVCRPYLLRDDDRNDEHRADHLIDGDCNDGAHNDVDHNVDGHNEADASARPTPCQPTPHRCA